MKGGRTGIWLSLAVCWRLKDLGVERGLMQGMALNRDPDESFISMSIGLFSDKDESTDKQQNQPGFKPPHPTFSFTRRSHQYERRSTRSSQRVGCIGWAISSVRLSCQLSSGYRHVDDHKTDANDDEPDKLTSGTLTQIKHVLKPDGVFIGAVLGGDTLFELR